MKFNNVDLNFFGLITFVEFLYSKQGGDLVSIRFLDIEVKFNNILHESINLFTGTYLSNHILHQVTN